MTLAPARLRRKQLILDAAMDLFSRYGYSAVGVVEIANAVGITAPGLYRHYKNKQAILAAVLEKGAVELLEESERVVAEAATPLDALVAATRLSVGQVVDRKVLISAYYEARHLPEPERSRLRKQQRKLTEHYVDLILGVRSDLTRAEARVLALGTAGMAESVGHAGDGVQRDRLKQLVADGVLAAVLGSAVDSATDDP